MLYVCKRYEKQLENVNTFEKQCLGATQADRETHAEIARRSGGTSDDGFSRSPP